MIFGSIIRRAENAVESMLDQALGRVLVAIPLLVAAGFATASASIFVNNRYGPELGYLIMAAAFTVLALVVAAYVAAKSSGGALQTEAVETPASSESTLQESLTGSTAEPLTTSERDLLNSMLASAAPIAVPGITRLLLRNLPLVVAIIVAIYVFTRKAGQSAPVSDEAMAS